MTPVDAVPMPAGVTLEVLRDRLRDVGAVFAYLHGSRVAGTSSAGSDLDVAAWFGRPVDRWAVRLPRQVDLMVLDDAGLELAGRVAQDGVLLYDDDPPARVAWQAQCSKRYLDDAHRRRALTATLFGSGS